MDRKLAVAYGIAGIAVAIAFTAVLVSGDTRHPALDAPPPPAVAAATPAAEVMYVDAHGRPLRGDEVARADDHEEGEEGEEHEEDEDDEDDDDAREHEGRSDRDERHEHEGRGDRRGEAQDDD